MDIFLPNFTRINGVKSGGEYVSDSSVPFRLVLHTTETDGGALTMAKTHPWSPHVWCDPESKEKYQTIALNRSAYALAHPRGTIETNAMKAIQVEIVGRAATTQDWPLEWYDWLAVEVVGPLCKAMGINHNNVEATYGAGQGIVLASKSSRVRMSEAKWRTFNGICCHQHVPVNDHWDCGDFNIERIVQTLNSGTPALPPPPGPVTPPAPKPVTYGVLTVGSSGAAVTILQQKLASLGYWLAADGSFGPATNYFVTAFQRAKNLRVDGVVGPATWAALDKAIQTGWKVPTNAPVGPPVQSKPPTVPRPRHTLRRGDNNAEVKKLQNALNLFDQRLTADGSFGPATEQAVKNFQAYWKIGSDGVYGPKTASTLDAALALVGK